MNFLPVFTLLFNLIFIQMLEITLVSFLPTTWLPFDHYTRTIIFYIIMVFFMYSRGGQMIVANVINGRCTIGREERIFEPLMEELKEKTDIKGFSSAVWVQFKILNALNKTTFGIIKPLNRRVNRIKNEYLTGTVRIFTFDSLDLETNSYGNSIFISKGAIDTLTYEELRAVVYNEFAQIKTNISNIRLFHDGTILLSRICSVLTVLLAPFAIIFNIANSIHIASLSHASSNDIFQGIGNILVILVLSLFSLIRIAIWLITRRNTNVLYMAYERRIFVRADRATNKAGFSADMLSYLEKLYVFKLNNKDTKIFKELRPLVAYRINYFDNVLGRNRTLLESNHAWSSNYIEEE